MVNYLEIKLNDTPKRWRRLRAPGFSWVRGIPCRALC